MHLFSYFTENYWCTKHFNKHSITRQK